MKETANDTAAATLSAPGGAASRARRRALRALRNLLVLCCVLGLLPALGGVAQAATLTWNGMTSPNWSVATNWTPNQVPATGDTLIFSQTSPNMVTNNDLAANTSFTAITISIGGYTLTGNPLSVTTGLTASNASGTSTVSLNVGGAGSVTKNGGTATAAGNLVLSGTNSFTGTVTISFGSITATNSSSLGTGTKAVNINQTSNNNPQLLLNGSGGDITLPSTFTYSTSNSTTGSFINVADNNTIAGTIILTSGGGDTGIVTNAGNLTISANISANTTGRNVRLRGAATGAITGVLSNGTNPVGLFKENAGTWTLTNTNTYTGATTISGGTLLVNGSIAASATTINGGILGGTGTVGPVTQTASTNSILAPGPQGAAGTAAAVGTLNSGNVALSSGNSFNVDLASAASADRLNTVGTVALGNASLVVNLGFAPTTADPAIVIISNDGTADLTTGTFVQGNTVSASFGGTSFTFAINNNGGDGNDVTLTPMANQPPVNFFNGAAFPAAAPMQSTDEDTPLVFSTANSNALSVTDPDIGNGLLSVTVQVNSGTLVLGGTTGLTGLTGNGGPTVTFSGSVANVNNALNGLTFRPVLNDTVGATLTITTSDGQGPNANGATGTDTDRVAITIRAINDAPVVTTSGGSLIYTENAPPTPIDPGITVTDADSATLTGASVSLGLSFMSGQDVLAFTDPDGVITGTFNPATGVLTLSGSASPAQYQAALASVTYQNLSDNPNTTPRSVTFSVSDGNGSDNDTRGISIVPVNDAPVVSGVEASTVTFTEGGAPVSITNTLTLSDADSATLSGATVSLGGTFIAGQDVLSFSDQNGITGAFNSATGLLTLSGSATVADYQTALRSVTFSNTSSDPNGSTRTATFQVDDGSAANNLSSTTGASRNIAVAATNDAPVISGIETTPLAFAEGGAPTPITSTLVISDVDNAVLTGATIRFTAGFASGQDVLGFAAQNGITGTFNSATGVLTLSGSATVANYQTALRSVTFANTSENPSAANRTVSFQVSDGRLASNAPTRGIAVAPVNDAPVLAGVPATALVFAEDSAPIAIAPAITASDVDSATFSGATVRFTAGFAGAQDVLGFMASSTITGFYNATSGVLTFSGAASVADYQAILRSVTFSNTSNAPSTSTRTVAFQVVDESTVNAASNSPTRDITITTSNDAPTLDPITPNPLNLLINAAQQTIQLRGISDGDGGGQAITITATSSNPRVISNVTVNYTSPNSTGTLSFKPTLNESGRADITITVTDNGTPARSFTTVLRVNVGGADEPPRNAIPGAQSTPEDTALVFAAASNNGISVSDVDDPTLSVTLTATQGTLLLRQVSGLTFNAGANGQSSFKVTGSQANLNAALEGLRFVPALNFNGSVLLTVSTEDVDQTDTDTISIAVTPVNDAPALSINSGLTVNEGSENNVISGANLQTTDVDNTPAQRRFTITALPSSGTLLRGGVPLALGGAFTQADVDGGVLRYSQDGSEALTDSFSFTVSDGAGGTIAERSFAIAIRPVNDAPTISAIANRSIARGSSTGAIAFTVGDAETAAANLTITASSSDTTLVPNSGIVIGGSGANRTITITPAARQVGRATITVRVSDGVLGTSTVFVLTVANSNQAPTSVPDAYSTNEDSALTIAAPGVLGNDTDFEGDDLSAILVSNPSNGRLDLLANGRFVYEPAPNFAGTDSFSYRASDGGIGGNPVSVTLTVRAVNDAPVAIAQNLSTPEDTPLDITFSATDVDNVIAGLSFRVVRAPSRGTLQGDGPRRRYTPARDFSGVDSFTFVASDGTATSSEVTVTINVGGSNDAPVALADVATTNEDRPINLQVLANDFDLDRDVMRIVRLAVTPATHGTVGLNRNGTLRFTPERNFSGVGVFTYTISDGVLEDTTNVSVTIRPVNDAPIAFSQVVSVRQDSSLPIALFATDVDTNASSLRFGVVRRPLRGTITAFTGLRGLTYTPVRGFVGTDTFTFRATDGRLGSNIATVTIRVLSASQVSLNNRAPVAVADSYAVRGPLQVLAAQGVLRNDSDADGQPLSAALKTAPQRGTLEFRADGSFTYRPAISFSGTDSFSYAASDGGVQSAAVTVTLRVTPLPDTTPPVVTIAGGTQRAVTRLAAIRGSAADVYVNSTGLVATSDLRDVVVQLQRSNGDYWNGQSYQDEPFDLPTRQEARSFYAVPESVLPPMSPLGRYTWTAIATDNAGNQARATQVMVVSSTLGS